MITISGEEIPNIFQLIIEKANTEIEAYDAKVSKTIENIIERFFQKKENSLLYFCSEEDHKAHLRHQIFDRWYKSSEFRENVVKLIDLEIQKLYISFMFLKENSNCEMLIKIYNEIENSLNSVK